MFDARRYADHPASWAYYLQQQELALSGKITVAEITTEVVGDDCSYVERNNVQFSALTEALSALPFPAPPAEAVEFMAANFCVQYLIPVADPHRGGSTWPTILVPSDGDPIFGCSSSAVQERILEILREWRNCVDVCASAIPCSPLGWIGGIWVPHPAIPDDHQTDHSEMSMRWPWLHRPYNSESRLGDHRLFDLFKVSVAQRR